MNWKTEAAEKLRRYDAMHRALVNIPQELGRLKEECSAMSSGLAVSAPTGGNVRRREDAMMNNLVARQELQWSLDQARVWTETVNRALSVLDPEERLVLHQLFIRPDDGGMEALCEKLRVEKTSIYRRRDRALQKFTIALYGAVESN